MCDRNWHTSVFCIPGYSLRQEYNGVTLCDRELMYRPSPKVGGIRAGVTWLLLLLREEGVPASRWCEEGRVLHRAVGTSLVGEVSAAVTYDTGCAGGREWERRVGGSAWRKHRLVQCFCIPNSHPYRITRLFLLMTSWFYVALPEIVEVCIILIQSRSAGSDFG